MLTVNKVGFAVKDSISRQILAILQMVKLSQIVKNWEITWQQSSPLRSTCWQFSGGQSQFPVNGSWSACSSVSLSWPICPHTPDVDERISRCLFSTDQFPNASLLVQKLELKNETYLTIERMLSEKAAHYDLRDIMPKSFLISSGVTMYYR